MYDLCVHVCVWYCLEGREGMGEGEGLYLIDASFRREMLQVSVVHARLLLPHGRARTGQQEEDGQEGCSGGKDGGAWWLSSWGSGMELSRRHHHQARWTERAQKQDVGQ